MDDDEDFEGGWAASEARPPNELEAVPDDAAECGACRGRGALVAKATSPPKFCERCAGAGFLGVPVGPTTARPGSRWKVAVLAARYARGLELWHAGDRSSHGPDGHFQ